MRGRETKKIAGGCNGLIDSELKREGEQDCEGGLEGEAAAAYLPRVPRITSQERTGHVDQVGHEVHGTL